MTGLHTKYPYRSPGDHIFVQSSCRRLLSGTKQRYEVRYVDSALGATGVVTSGTRSALPAIVVVAGTEVPAAAMTALIDVLGPSRQVFVVDPPGMPGLSDPRYPVRDLWTVYGQWFDTVLAQLTSSPVTVIGYGFGAAIAVSAPRHVHVTDLVLAAPIGLSPIRQTAASRWHRWRWHTDADPQSAERFLRVVTGTGFKPDADLVALYCTIGAHYLPLRIRPLVPDDAITQKAEHVPITIAVGGDDPFLTEPVRGALGGRVPQASIHLLDGVGHLIPLEAPEQLAALADSATSTAPSPAIQRPGRSSTSNHVEDM
ncbi:alpha/beta hydrolase [Rhodococcus pyridinivorans]|uniref:alpha/beta fold hydrolase n=1 Tax=Rhodococcus pyridinivorans TaxID=103816 RepID=UPI001E548A90|nr:alpha/beta hydrolase [Rhodococcus pyridinivorans]UGQ58528.1 alpha/beta hydrolase [Rhodococcus pyridinivorans]